MQMICYCLFNIKNTWSWAPHNTKSSPFQHLSFQLTRPCLEFFIISLKNEFSKLTSCSLVLSLREPLDFLSTDTAYCNYKPNVSSLTSYDWKPILMNLIKSCRCMHVPTSGISVFGFLAHKYESIFSRRLCITFLQRQIVNLYHNSHVFLQQLKNSIHTNLKCMHAYIIIFTVFLQLQNAVNVFYKKNSKIWCKFEFLDSTSL